ncbi:MAG: DUF4388 domain-containing protein [Actinomycetota bacterium]
MLQGSLDDFALEEVLELLSSTSKTGKLEVKGDRGHGALRLNEGRLVDAEASYTANGVESEDVLFELLRFADGNFHFTASKSEEGSHADNVSEVLEAAQARLADWRTIEAIVPSLRHIVTPVPELPDEEVTLTRREWAVLIVVGSSCPASAVCDELDLSEVEGSRRIKELTERGLLAVGPPKTTSLRRSSGDTRSAAAARRSPAMTASSMGQTSGAGAPSPAPASAPAAPVGAGYGAGQNPTPVPTPAPGAAPAPVGADYGREQVDRFDPRRPGPLDSERAPAALASNPSPAPRTSPTPSSATTDDDDGGLLMRYLKSDD